MNNRLSSPLCDWKLALTSAPPSSDIFVFTDAPARDFQLKSIVTALIESTKSKVTVCMGQISILALQTLMQSINEQ